MMRELQDLFSFSEVQQGGQMRKFINSSESVALTASSSKSSGSAGMTRREFAGAATGMIAGLLGSSAGAFAG